MAFLSGCRHASHLEGERQVVPDAFSLEPPDPAQWRLSTDRQRGPQKRLGWTRRGGGAHITCQVRPLRPEERPLSLDLLGERLFQAQGLLEWSDSQISAIQMIVVDERQGVAVVGSRLERPRTQVAVTLVVRGPDHLLLIDLRARPELQEAAAQELERLLRRFRVLLPGPFDPMVVEPLPAGPPGPAPWRVKPGPKPKAPRQLRDSPPGTRW